MAEAAKKAPSLELVPLPAIQQRILLVRERHVMVDEDLAELYGVETRRLIEQVKRNAERFPPDFMFQLSKDEAAALRSQSARSMPGRGGRRYAPYVFTEQGVAMLSSVLRSKRAVAVNIAIMRAFVELRRAAASYAAIERRLDDLERETQARLGRHDQQLEAIFKALRQLIAQPPRRKTPNRVQSARKRTVGGPDQQPVFDEAGKPELLRTELASRRVLADCVTGSGRRAPLAARRRCGRTAREILAQIREQGFVDWRALADHA